MFTKKRSCLKVVELLCICSKPTESKTWSSPLHKQIWPIKQTKFKVKTRVNKQCHLTVPTVHIAPLLTLQQTLNCDNVGANKLRTHQLLTCLRTKQVRSCFAPKHKQARSRPFVTPTFRNLFSPLVFGGGLPRGVTLWWHQLVMTLIAD